jgi:hypothetical protein
MSAFPPAHDFPSEFGAGVKNPEEPTTTVPTDDAALLVQ